jgi:dihydroxy-acid dehydratase
MPGCLIAAARHNRPTIIIYGGTIQPGIRHVDCLPMGYSKGGTVNISDAFESFGNYQIHAQLVRDLIRIPYARRFYRWENHG